MRRGGLVASLVAIFAVVLGIGGLWTYRLGQANQQLAFALEAERQRNFNEMVHHVEQIQSMMGKGLVTGSTRQNMRFMGDVHHHAMAAVNNFTSLPLPQELSTSTGKFLQQTGDFAVSLLRNEAAGREMDEKQRAELARLRQESATLSAKLQEISAQYNQGMVRWAPPTRMTWGKLFRGDGLQGKPNSGNQAPASIAAAGFNQLGTTMEKLPVMIYDGPFSDHIAERKPAMAGAPVTQAEAENRMRGALPNAGTYKIANVSEVGGNLPAFSFRLAPNAAAGNAYTTTADVTKNGGYLVQFLNSRMIGNATIDLDRATELGSDYLASIGYNGLIPTYGDISDGAATIAYVYKTDDVIVYPDQIKVKVALDNGEILGLDARQYLMSHHTRTLPAAKLTVDEAQQKLNGGLSVQRSQMALIPDQAGTGEILTYEFLTTLNDQTYLVYINANTGAEEQVLQFIQTNGGTFAM